MEQAHVALGHGFWSVAGKYDEKLAWCVQVVVAGCEGEVHMYSLFVDDTAAAGQQALATALKALAAGERLPQVSLSASLASAHSGKPCWDDCVVSAEQVHCKQRVMGQAVRLEGEVEGAII